MESLEVQQGRVAEEVRTSATAVETAPDSDAAAIDRHLVDLRSRAARLTGRRFITQGYIDIDSRIVALRTRNVALTDRRIVGLLAVRTDLRNRLSPTSLAGFREGATSGIVGSATDVREAIRQGRQAGGTMDWRRIIAGSGIVVGAGVLAWMGISSLLKRFGLMQRSIDEQAEARAERRQPLGTRIWNTVKWPFIAVAGIATLGFIGNSRLQARTSTEAPGTRTDILPRDRTDATFEGVTFVRMAGAGGAQEIVVGNGDDRFRIALPIPAAGPVTSPPAPPQLDNLSARVSGLTSGAPQTLSLDLNGGLTGRAATALGGQQRRIDLDAAALLKIRTELAKPENAGAAEIVVPDVVLRFNNPTADQLDYISSLTAAGARAVVSGTSVNVTTSLRLSNTLLSAPAPAITALAGDSFPAGVLTRRIYNVPSTTAIVMGGVTLPAGATGTVTENGVTLQRLPNNRLSVSVAADAAVGNRTLTPAGQPAVTFEVIAPVAPADLNNQRFVNSRPHARTISGAAGVITMGGQTLTAAATAPITVNGVRITRLTGGNVSLQIAQNAPAGPRTINIGGTDYTIHIDAPAVAPTAMGNIRTGSSRRITVPATDNVTLTGGGAALTPTDLNVDRTLEGLTIRRLSATEVLVTASSTAVARAHSLTIGSAPAVNFNVEATTLPAGVELAALPATFANNVAHTQQVNVPAGALTLDTNPASGVQTLAAAGTGSITLGGITITRVSATRVTLSIPASTAAGAFTIAVGSATKNFNVTAPLTGAAASAEGLRTSTAFGTTVTTLRDTWRPTNSVRLAALNATQLLADTDLGTQITGLNTAFNTAVPTVAHRTDPLVVAQAEARVAALNNVGFTGAAGVKARVAFRNGAYELARSYETVDATNTLRKNRANFVNVAGIETVKVNYVAPPALPTGLSGTEVAVGTAPAANSFASEARFVTINSVRYLQITPANALTGGKISVQVGSAAAVDMEVVA